MRTAIFLATLALPLFAAAAPGGKPPWFWLAAEIRFDSASWRMSAPDAATRVFTCITPECEGQPAVYGFAWPAGDRREALAEACGSISTRGELTPLVADGKALHGEMKFQAFTSWTGCRAVDTPVLQACAASDGIAYRLTTSLGSGCNRAPELPDGRFEDLLRSIIPFVPAVLR